MESRIGWLFMYIVLMIYCFNVGCLVTLGILWGSPIARCGSFMLPKTKAFTESVVIFDQKIGGPAIRACA